MNEEEKKIDKIICEIEDMSFNFSMSKQKIIEIYLLKEIINLNEQIKNLNDNLKEYLIYKDSY